MLQVFEVKAKVDSALDDAAYSTDELLLHSDQNFYESSPGIQILFCMQWVYEYMHYSV